MKIAKRENVMKKEPRRDTKMRSKLGGENRICIQWAGQQKKLGQFLKKGGMNLPQQPSIGKKERSKNMQKAFEFGKRIGKEPENKVTSTVEHNHARLIVKHSMEKNKIKNTIYL